MIQKQKKKERKSFERKKKKKYFAKGKQLVTTCLQRQRTTSRTEPNYFLTFRFRELKFSAIFSYVAYQRTQILKTTPHGHFLHYLWD